MSLRAEVSDVTLSSAAVSAQTLAVQRAILTKLEAIQESFTQKKDTISNEENAGEIVAELMHHAELLARIKSDLDQIYFRIRSTKRKLQDRFPEAFSQVRGDASGSTDPQGGIMSACEQNSSRTTEFEQ